MFFVLIVDFLCFSFSGQRLVIRTSGRRRRRSMDYGDDDRSTSWNWQVENYNHQTQSHFSDVPDCTMTEVTLNQEDHSYMFDDETTPVKACSELGYHVTTEDTNRKMEVHSETRSALKRRRMLQFEDQPETSLFSSESFSAILKSSARDETFDELLPEGSQLIEGFSDASASSFEGLDLYAEEWYAECLNDAETPMLPDDLSFGSPDVQVDISEYLNVPPETETREAQRPVTRSSPNVIFKAGRKSFSRPVSKLPSSIIYPFAFIKPCGVHGGMTLKDINQKIRNPPAKPKQHIEEPAVIQTSAFSGKPVVGKTKIRTEGGKGSITIMRTRG
ncbi:protein XRI1 isoform X3 [Arabidopsis lyrata subsp. lyrata]|uniref:protein XRI1 isoform X3 n=1 Tax=Arabidopsis lyrata subsp. lyrata TaxID=81972 RepID=UPI000A29C87D|nr:protein XRI1 isoform X3 [Arabidopsis lyrata subsp. lyrata]|eukprot:XP_020871715.1 protein XRI1 isoform X3 [Arabidopsis lyrata subsp. lyrata]